MEKLLKEIETLQEQYYDGLITEVEAMAKIIEAAVTALERTQE